MRTQPSEKTKINLNTLAQTTQRAGSRNRYACLYKKRHPSHGISFATNSQEQSSLGLTYTMKSLSRPAVSTVSILLIFYIGYSWARSYQVKYLFLIL